ncbi:phosphopantetheine-binding protein [Amycolatopsis sp. NPDC026612]|uniref:acyl carrier protein n=1 Tax=Amycolatopsis sp. NPDC026612 TaxID=3155466 RepID=UPI0033C25594
MTTQDSVLDIVRSAVQDVAPGAELTDDLPLIVERIIDSLSLLKVVTRLEQDLGVRIRDVEVLPRNFETITAIRAFLATKGH